MPLRIPTSLHETIKLAARHEGVSLNQYCLYLLSHHLKTPEEYKTQKAEELLKFLEEASVLQKELGKNSPPSKER